MPGTRSERTVRAVGAGARSGPATGAGAGRVLAVRWAISRSAAVALGLACERDGAVSLELSVELNGAEGQMRVGEVGAVLREGDRERAFEVGMRGGVCITDAETGLTHIDVPGVVQISLRMGEPEKPPFARTALLEKMGLAGGRYEFLGGSLDP